MPSYLAFSRSGIENLDFSKFGNYAVISIRDIGSRPVKIENTPKMKDLLVLEFDDIEFKGRRGGITEEQAAEIVEFVMANQDLDTIIVHCEAGNSRSRAVVVTCCQLLKSPCPYDLSAGNPLVKQKLRDAFTAYTPKRPG